VGIRTDSQVSMDVGQIEVQEVVGAYFEECADPESGGVYFNRFCHCLHHYGLFSNDFDHERALEAFTQAAGGDVSASVDAKGFRSCLEELARTTYGGARHIWQQLEKLLSHISVHRESAFDPTKVGEMEGLLYDAELIRAVSRYSGVLRALFNHYADHSNGSDATVICRSAYRLFRALKLVPGCLVPGELLDLAVSFQPESKSIMEKRFHEEGKMISGGEDQDWTHAVKVPQSGEPRYNFPQLEELFVGIALCKLPRVHYMSTAVRLQRIQEVFETFLHLPMDQHGFDAKKYLRQTTAKHCYLSETSDVSEKRDKGAPRRISMEAVFDRLRTELPILPEPQETMPVPRPSQTGGLIQQPQTVEEELEEIAEAQAKAAAKASAKSKLRPSAKPAVTAPLKRRKVYEQKAWADRRDVPFGEPCWYGKRPMPSKPIIPPQYQVDSRALHLEMLEQSLQARNQRMSSLAGPVTGWVLRTTLINEPLRAPHCKESEEVSTLIETALTSRRLRNYDIAISLLIRARRLWAARVAGRDGTSAWADFQPHVSVPSPWKMPVQPPYAEYDADVVSPSSDIPDPGLDRPIGPSDLVRDAAEAVEASPGVDATNAMSRKISHEHVRVNGCTGKTITGMHSPRSASRLDVTLLPQDCAYGSESSPAVPSNSLGVTAGLGAEVTNTGKVYDPQLHFASVCGEDDENIRHLVGEVNLFFFCELASLHSAIHEDELAAQLLWCARPYSDSLPSNHPDTAVVWCGMGRVAFHTGAYDIAARAMARARRIRERTVGQDTVEAATTYNNLACCFTALGRSLEAIALLELAGELFKVLLGHEHPRTQTALRNLDKTRSSQKHICCEVPHLFGIPVRDLHKVKTGKKKKKKKGGGQTDDDDDGVKPKAKGKSKKK
jgi:tetratricopeptide (TPR) repeat protein